MYFCAAQVALEDKVVKFFVDFVFLEHVFLLDPAIDPSVQPPKARYVCNKSAISTKKGSAFPYATAALLEIDYSDCMIIKWLDLVCQALNRRQCFV